MKVVSQWDVVVEAGENYFGFGRLRLRRSHRMLSNMGIFDGTIVNSQ